MSPSLKNRRATTASSGRNAARQAPPYSRACRAAAGEQQRSEPRRRWGHGTARHGTARSAAGTRCSAGLGWRAAAWPRSPRPAIVSGAEAPGARLKDPRERSRRAAARLEGASSACAAGSGVLRGRSRTTRTPRRSLPRLLPYALACALSLSPIVALCGGGRSGAGPESAEAVIPLARARRTESPLPRATQAHEMPSATNSTMASSGSGKAGPGGSEQAPAAAAAAPQASGGSITSVQTEAMKQILGVIDKKLRNLEKKKSKLDDYQERMNKGERLNQDQLDAVSKYQEVTNNLEFAKELQRSFMALSQDIQKTIKKTARREQLMREEAEQKRLKTVLELQFILDKLGDDEVRSDLKQGSNGVPVLTEEELTMLDEFYKLVYPERDMSMRLNEQYEQASVHLWDLLEGKEKPVCGTTYKALKEVVERILQTSYFDSTHNHQNGLCEEEETAPTPAVEDTAAEEPDPAEEFTEPTEVESTEYVNRQFMAETQFSSSEKEQVDEWTVETVEVVNSLQQQTQATSPPVPEPHALTTVAQADPLVRRQRVQDLMAQMQGPYNFMQDSMLEFENQTLDPAIVSAQPMNPAQNLDMPQMVCPPVHTESRLAQPNQVPVQPEATQVPLVSSTSEGYTASQPMYQPSHSTEQRPQKESIDQIQASMSLNADQTPSSSSLPTASQPQVFQAGSSKPLHSSGINVNAAPFQSMQTVFNMNAPVPPVNEPETLKQQNQYQASYNQSFSNQPHQVEQSDLQQEQLQTVVGTYHGSPDQTHQVAGNHQQPPQQNTGFPRNSQPYYNSRGVSRGGSRGTRGLMNGYRGPANGFRGGYDGYRPSFSNTPNSGYTQPQFNAPRDYSNYQRDGYQQNFKRGSGQSGPRGAPRGRGGPPRPNRGMPQMNAQQVN